MGLKHNHKTDGTTTTTKTITDHEISPQPGSFSIDNAALSMAFNVTTGQEAPAMLQTLPSYTVPPTVGLQCLCRLLGGSGLRRRISGGRRPACWRAGAAARHLPHLPHLPAPRSAARASRRHRRTCMAAGGGMVCGHGGTPRGNAAEGVAPRRTEESNAPRRRRS
jgi:hypothetical protein